MEYRFICEQCGKENIFTGQKAATARYINQRFCNVKCSNKWKSGDNHPKPWLGKSLPEEMKERIKKNVPRGSDSPFWKGDDVGYAALHMWIKKYKHKVDKCEICGSNDDLVLANISGKYKRDVDDFLWLCKKCHYSYDGMHSILQPFRKMSKHYRQRDSKGRFV